MATLRNPFLFLLFAAFFAQGCQSSRQMSLLKPVPPGIQPARIYLMRPHRFAGDATAHSLFLDGQLITQIASGDYTVFEVVPGPHMIAVKAEGGMGFDSHTLECAKGEEYFFRATFSMAQLSSSQGKRMMERLHLIESH